MHEPGVQALLIPDLLGYWLTGRAGRRGHQRLHHRTARRPHRAVVHRTDRHPRPAHRAAARGWCRRAPWSGDLTAAVARTARPGPAADPDHRRLPRHRLRHRRGAGREPELRLHLLRHLGSGRRRTRRTRSSPRTSRAANFTNERGVDGTIRYLRNVMGLWLLSETLRTWRAAGPRRPSLTELLAQAAELPAGGPTFDPDAPRVPAARRHAGPRSSDACRGTGQRVPADPAARSSAASWTAWPITFAARIADAHGSPAGGSTSSTSSAAARRTQLLCQLIADAAGRPSSPVRSRPPRWATSSCRPARTACCPAICGRCAPSCAPR